MDTDDPTWRAFLEVFGALPRQGPGSAEATRAALDLVPDLPAAPRIVDAGCGSGASTLVLAEALPRAHLVAVDVVDVLLDRLRARVRELGLEARVEVEHRSMDALTLRGVDLVWSEGAAYSVGVDAALRHWADVLRPGGFVVFSEACWFVPPDERPRELVDWWRQEYPALQDEDGVRSTVECAGPYTVVATRRLELEAWTADYYGPLRARCAELRRGTVAPGLDAVLTSAEREVALFERYPGRVGYTFFVARRD